MDFTVSTREEGGCSVVACAGELDAHSAPLLEAQLGPLAAVGGASIVVDLSEVGFIDSTGLGVLVTTLKHVREVDGRLDVVVTSSRVLKVFTITGLNAVIPVHASLEAALTGR